MIAFHPQKMLVAEFDRPVYRGCHSSFTRLVRRCDDSNTPQFDRRLVGTVSVLRGGLALELSPCRGSLQAAIRSLAEKTWSHPVTGRDVRVAAGTIARWYYTALRQPDDPVGSLRRAVRKDCGKISPGSGPGRAAPAPVPRSPALELPTALRQPRRLCEGRSLTGAAPLLFHGQALHAGSRPGDASPGSGPAHALAKRVRKQDARRGRSAATKPPTSERSGISISTMDRSRCSLPAASGSARSRWASSTTTRDCAATSSGTSRRPPRTWCTGSPRRSRSGVCRVRS